MKQFSTIFTNEYELQKMQDNAADVLNVITSKQILDGNLLQNVSLISGQNSIPHLLGRPALGWIIVDKNATCDVYSFKSFDNVFLYLQSSGAVTMSLWVF